MQIVVNNLMTRYDAYGRADNPCVLLLHGWGDRAAGLQGLAKKLEADYYVIALDLPGFGGTDAPVSVWGLSDYATFVEAFIRKLGLKTQVIVGHSNGGAIAIRGLAEQKLKAERLVLLASAGIRSEYEGRKKGLRYTAKAGKLAVSWLPKRVQSNIKKKAYSAIGSDMFVAEHMQPTFKKIITDDVSHDATQVTSRTLLIYGDRDEATPAAYGERLQAAIPGAKLKVLAGAGHFVHVDEPQETMQYIREFLK